ncbi:hypothetical protein BX666DRAFT_1965444 [Dichotomocladium elegans]|nr:hypothetical protein BX666DRAFT_1965444 [Dichotomocladium elegans]
MGMPTPTSTADGTSAELLANAQSLMKRKDEIEAQLREYEEILHAQGDVGMDQPLVDNEGFPRADVDIVQVRTARNMVIRLRNDYKALMKEVENALYAIHEASRREKAATTAAAAEAAGGGGAITTTRALPSPTLPITATDPAIPFARVNAVAPDSPAYEAGLRRDDRLVQFGTVHAANHDQLQALNALVRQSEGKPIQVIVLRSGTSDPCHLTLTPRQGWGGRGTLGCHIVPISGNM